MQRAPDQQLWSSLHDRGNWAQPGNPPMSLLSHFCLAPFRKPSALSDISGALINIRSFPKLPFSPSPGEGGGEEAPIF